MTNKLENALIEAIEDEYIARASYTKIIQAFGEIRPFINIVEAEGRHIEALLPLFKKYGFHVPQDNWPGRVEVPQNILEACQSGVEAEIENAEMYIKLLAETIDYADVQAVFKNLQRASQENHLSAFQRCVDQGGMTGGKGACRGGGGGGGGRHGHHRQGRN